METRYISALVALAVLLVGASAHAQTMYRCGNKYQDRPCDANQKGRAVGNTGAASAARPAGASDAECAQRGKDALKVVWSREGGATLERLMGEIDSSGASAARKAEDKRFVQDVYRRPGAAGQVQSAVEADCIVEKEKAERAASLAAAAAKAQQELRPGSSAAPSAPPAQIGDPAAAERARQQTLAQEAERRKARCSRINASLDQLATQERSGGSAATMDRLREQRRQLREESGRAGC
ncbi:MAG: hypothetical protein ACT4P9_18650 [Betaproteobacteria bacterium]